MNRASVRRRWHAHAVFEGAQQARARSASDLAVQAGRALLMRMPFSPPDLDEVILGLREPVARRSQYRPRRRAAHGMRTESARVDGHAQLRVGHAGAGFGRQQHSRRVDRVSCLQAGSMRCRARRSCISDKMVFWFANFQRREVVGAKASAFLKLRPAEVLTPVIGIMKGLTDPMVGLLMGRRPKISLTASASRARDMDKFAAESHRRVTRCAAGSGHFDGKSSPCSIARARLYAADDGVREDSTAENLAKLKPFFDRKYGNVTAGQQFADHRWRRVADPGLRRRGVSTILRRSARFLDSPVGGTGPGADGTRAGARRDADPATPCMKLRRH